MDLEKLIKKMLTLSDLIVTEWYTLSELSYYEQENSDRFLEHVKNVREYLEAEKQILDELDIDKLEEICQILPKFDDKTDAFSRLSCNIDDKIAEYNDNEEELIDDADTDTQLAEFLEEYSNIKFAPLEIDKYYVDEADTERYSALVIDRVAEIAIKEMPHRIRRTFANTKQDYKFKRRLLKEFNNFKYFFFSLDYILERMGAECMFDLEKMPMIKDVSGDVSAISHNQCVTILDKIYAVNTDETDIEKISEALFNMICLEEYMKNISDKSVDVLLLLCCELEIALGKRFYGEIAHKKLILKKGNKEKD